MFFGVGTLYLGYISHKINKNVLKNENEKYKIQTELKLKCAIIGIETNMNNAKIMIVYFNVSNNVIINLFCTKTILYDNNKIISINKDKMLIGGIINPYNQNSLFKENCNLSTIKLYEFDIKNGANKKIEFYYSYENGLGKIFHSHFPMNIKNEVKRLIKYQKNTREKYIKIVENNNSMKKHKFGGIDKND